MYSGNSHQREILISPPWWVAGMICTSTHLGTLPEAYRWTSIYQEALHPPWWRDQYLAYIVIQVIHLPHPVTRNCIGYTAIQHIHLIHLIQYTAAIQRIHYTSLYTPPLVRTRAVYSCTNDSRKLGFLQPLQLGFTGECCIL